MKKIISLLIVLASPGAANAQPATSYIDREMFAVGVSIIAGGFVLLFVLEIIKRLFEYQLKRKALELGLPDVQTKSQQDRAIPIKWFIIWTGLGIGLTLVRYSLPLGIHSLAIMSFCIAASFLGYFFFLKQSGK